MERDVTAQLDHAPSPQPAPELPQWEQTRDELLCPLCDYNLRGLVEPRCPECGYQFDWHALQQEKAREHPYLFEHHHRNNLSSFFCTFTRSALRPRRFWRELQPLHRPKLRRLMMYWVVAAVLCVLLASPMLVTPMVTKYFDWLQAQRQWLNYAQSSPQLVTQITNRYGSPQAFANAMAGRSFATAPGASVGLEIWIRDVGAPVIVIMLCWPWLTFAALLLYRASLRQAMIHRSHVLRCAVYSADALFLIAPLLILCAPLKDRSVLSTWWLDWLYHPFGYHTDPSIVLPLALIALLLTYRLAIAYRHYLRFRHSILAVVASQLIVWLIVFKCYFYWRVGY
jgi:hypothetical protein